MDRNSFKLVDSTSYLSFQILLCDIIIKFWSFELFQLALKIWQFGIFSQVIPLGLCGVLKFLVRVRYIISTVHLGFSAKPWAVSIAFLHLLFGMSLLCD